MEGGCEIGASEPIRLVPCLYENIDFLTGFILTFEPERKCVRRQTVIVTGVILVQEEFDLRPVTLSEPLGVFH